MNSFELARQKGFIFPGARGWMNTRDARHMEALAQDAALVSTPNATVPAEFLAYIDPMVIEILTAVRNARKIFPEVKKGDWTTPYEKFRVEEFTGVTTPYSDYADGGESNVNENWPAREQYRFQTTIKYGDLEVDMAAVAKMNLASSKQKSAARIIDIDANRFYLYGVAGKEIYGLLNDPNLNPSITPGTAAGSGTAWSGKTANEIYGDILLLWGELKQNSGGNINEDTKLVLALSPESNSQLGKINELGLSVVTMLKNLFGDRLELVELPELYSSTAGNTIMMLARDILGTPVAQLGFGEKYRAGRVVPELSSFKQKITATTYGCILYYPFAVTTMEGV